MLFCSGRPAAEDAEEGDHPRCDQDQEQELRNRHAADHSEKEEQQGDDQEQTEHVGLLSSVLSLLNGRGSSPVTAQYPVGVYFRLWLTGTWPGRTRSSGGSTASRGRSAGSSGWS